jgi:hypothetical protein
LKGQGAEQPGHSDGEYRREEGTKGRVEQRSLSSGGGAQRTVTASTQAAIGKHSQLEINYSPNREPVEVLQGTHHMLSTTNAKDEPCSRVKHHLQTIK